VIRRLAVGGMGEIFLARQEIAGVNRLVVLKRLLPELAEDPQLLDMFVDEARIAANLAHPGIVQVHEFGHDTDGHFIVMEYVPGHHLGHVVTRALRARMPMPVRLGAHIVHEVARALDHAHHARDSDGKPLEIVHRDISPSNVLVSYRGDVKLMDFGVARAANRAHRTSDGSVRGKFSYMAPEQIEGKLVDARTDVFAVGVVLWEITLGRRLFSGGSDFEVIRAALEQPIPRPSSIDPAYPPELDDLVMSALERDRDRRLASAAAIATGLKSYLRTSPVDRDDLAGFMAVLFPDEIASSARLDEETKVAPKTERPTVLLAEPPTEPEPSRRRGRALVPLLLLFVTCAGILGVWWLRRDRGASGAHVAAPLDAAGDAPSDASLDTPADVAIDAPIDAPVDARPDARHHPDAHTPPIDAAPDAIVSRGAFAFGLVGQGPVFLVHGDGCTTSSTPIRCKDLVVGTSHTFLFSSPGIGEFSATLEVHDGLTKCDVIPATKQVKCAR
jgi:serine/threonine protein kinase